MKTKAFAIVLAAVMLILPLALFASAEAEAGAQTGTVYYVDSEKGDDTGAGTSEALAWKSLEKVNATEFKPGDSVLFRSGGHWDGALWPKGEGTADAPITVGKYGGGALPVIRGNRTQTLVPLEDITEGKVSLSGMDEDMYNPVVFLGNQSYWIIENLEVTSTSDSATNNVGILLMTTGANGKTRGLTVRHCYVHDIAAEQERNVKMTGGILAIGTPTWIDGAVNTQYGKNNVGFDGVMIEGNHVKNVAKEGIRTTGLGSDRGPFRCKRPHRNVVIRGNFIEEVMGDGIVLSEVGGGGVVEYNVVKNFCNRDVGTFNYAGVWAWMCTDAVFRYNEVFGGEYGYLDGEAFDFDIGCVGVVFEYNFSHHNKGGLLLTMERHGLRSNLFRYNVSVNDGGGEGQELFHVHPDRVRVYNNTIYVGKDVETFLFQKGSVSYFKNNIVACAGDNLGFAREDKVRAFGFENNLFSSEAILKGSELSQKTLDKNLLGDPKLADPEGFEALYRSGYEIVSPVGGNYEAYLDALRERLAYFKITAESPAVNAGKLSNTQPLWAFLGGASLESGSYPDVGAHQFNEFKQYPISLGEKISLLWQDTADWVAYKWNRWAREKFARSYLT